MSITAAVVAARKPFTKRNQGNSIHRYDTLFTTIVLGTAGAITSQSEFKDSGMLFALTGSEAGRYDVQVWEGYKEVLIVNTNIVGADDTALTDAKGVITILRNLDAGEGAQTGVFLLQFVQNTDLADDDVQDSLTLKVEVKLRW